MNQISVGLLGFGLAGRVFHAPFIAAAPRLHLAAVSTSRAEAVHAEYPTARVRPTALEVIADADVELVVVATPNDTHFKLARAALLAGKHVVVDKPFTQTSTETLELERLAAEHNRVLVPFHNRRWDGDFRTVRKCLDENWLGHVHYFETRLDVWRTDYGLQGPDALFDKGPHLIDQALQLFGMPEAVFAELAIERAAAQAPDFFHIIMRYPGLTVVANASLASHGTTTRFVMHGERGSFHKRGIDGQGAAIRAGQRPQRADWLADDPSNHGELSGLDGQVRRIETERGDYRIFYEGVADAILSGKPLPVTAAEAHAVMQVIEACVQSAESGRLVRL